MKKIIDFFISLKFLFKPKYWMMNNPYSKEWDQQLNQLMEEHHFTDIGACTAQLGEHLIWISNYPYSTFTPYDTGMSDFRASRLTITRARKKLIKDMVLEFGRVKPESERMDEHVRKIHEHNRKIEEIKQVIKKLEDEIRNHPDNVTKYDNEKSLLDNAKVRKHTMKYG